MKRKSKVAQRMKRRLYGASRGRDKRSRPSAEALLAEAILRKERGRR